MERPATTRMELLERRARVALARRGRDLLERKRSALVVECTQRRELIARLRRDLEAACERAAQSLAEAEFVAGPAAVAAASLRPSGATVSTATTNIGGVRVPVLSLAPASPPMPPTIDRSPAIAAASAAFSAVSAAIVAVAQAEAQWQRLTAEAQRLSRQVNALDTVVIPRLEAECNHLELALEERERSERFQLKLVQRRLALRREA